MQIKNQIVVNHKVILDSIQDLPRLPLQLINSVRGRFQIKFGMTFLYSRGFTLIELLVVVLIIGILAAVAVPQYQVAVRKSEYAKLKPLVKTIANAEEAYFLANGTYTQDLDLLDVNLPPYEKHSGIIYYFGKNHCWASDRVFCALSGKIGYSLFLSHTDTDQGHEGLENKQVCHSYKDSISIKICKQESGLEEPSHGDTDYYW